MGGKSGRCREMVTKGVCGQSVENLDQVETSAPRSQLSILTLLNVSYALLSPQLWRDCVHNYNNGVHCEKS